MQNEHIEFPEHFLDLKDYEIAYLRYLKEKRTNGFRWRQREEGVI